MTEATISLVEPELVLSLFGAQDQHLKQIRATFGVAITHRDGEIHVTGDEENVTGATATLEKLKELVERRGELDPLDIQKALAMVTGSEKLLLETPIEVIHAAQKIVPRTPGQAYYVQAIRNNDLTFAIGPAGTGKTYLAVAMAVEALKSQQIRKIVLVRPAVEAGESLGYLPGDLQAKINPYLRPLLDALHEMIDYDYIQNLLEQELIEIIPLAYMRGRTLNQAFIILDEAQNATVSQMKMFLTRMGEGSKIVVSGDTTQVDLPVNTLNGLTDALTRLKDISRVAMVRMSKADIVRHRLVQEIVNAYENDPPTSGRKKRGGAK